MIRWSNSGKIFDERWLCEYVSDELITKDTDAVVVLPNMSVFAQGGLQILLITHTLLMLITFPRTIGV